MKILKIFFICKLTVTALSWLMLAICLLDMKNKILPWIKAREGLKYACLFILMTGGLFSASILGMLSSWNLPISPLCGALCTFSAILFSLSGLISRFVGREASRLFFKRHERLQVWVTFLMFTGFMSLIWRVLL